MELEFKKKTAVFFLPFNIPFGNFSWSFSKYWYNDPDREDVILRMIIENAKQLGELIKANRKEMGFTQSELANFCKVGNRFIVELESGKPTLQFDKVLNIARLVGLELTVTKRGS